MQPHIVAVAGLVPCAASGTMISRAREVAARLVVGADHRHAGELALRARHRRQRHARHAGDFLQHFLQFVQAGEETLSERIRRERMASDRKPGSIASVLQARGLYFIVHEPSG